MDPLFTLIISFPFGEGANPPASEKFLLTTVTQSFKTLGAARATPRIVFGPGPR
jgi:hypothetical protein